jgi:hypothetical protein
MYNSTKYVYSNAFLISTNNISDDAWLIDLGFSYHMTPHKVKFTSYSTYDGGEVFGGYNNTKKIVGRGNVKFRFNDGMVKTIDHVVHILGLVRNSLSISKLNNSRMHVTCDI